MRSHISDATHSAAGTLSATWPPPPALPHSAGRDCVCADASRLKYTNPQLSDCDPSELRVMITS